MIAAFGDFDVGAGARGGEDAWRGVGVEVIGQRGSRSVPGFAGEAAGLLTGRTFWAKGGCGVFGVRGVGAVVAGGLVGVGDVGDVLGGVGERGTVIGRAGFGQGLGDAELGGDDGVGERAGMLMDGGVGSADELLCFGFLLDERVVDGVERLDDEVVLEAGVDGGAGGGMLGELGNRRRAEALGQDRENWAGGLAGEERLRPRLKPGGGEDVLELAGADDGVNLRDVPLDLVPVTLDEAAGDDEFLGAAAVGDLVLDHLEDGVDGLLLCGVDERAGVDDENVGIFGHRGELGSAMMKEAHHNFRVDEILRATKGDEANLGLRRAGSDGGVLCDVCGGAHSLSVYQCAVV